MPIYELRVNGRERTVGSWDPEQLLLYVLRDGLELHGPRFGCGFCQCSACTALMNVRAVWSCVTSLRFPDVPAIDIAQIDRPDQPLMGAGEASVSPVGGALGNAISDATGVRLTRVLFTPAKMKAAMDAKRAG